MQPAVAARVSRFRRQVAVARISLRAAARDLAMLTDEKNACALDGIDVWISVAGAGTPPRPAPVPRRPD